MENNWEEIEKEGVKWQELYNIVSGMDLIARPKLRKWVIKHTQSREQALLAEYEGKIAEAWQKGYKEGRKE